MIITDESKLRQECRDISLFEAVGMVSKLEQELYNSSSPGIGLAANQIDLDAKVCIIRTGKQSLDLVNPKIIEQYDLMEFGQEGCLSYPGQFIKTKRFNEIVIEDLLHPAGLVCTGLLAVVAQHEIGHLYGETMYDYEIKKPSGPNMLCWCDSGKKYKKCHTGQEIKVY